MRIICDSCIVVRGLKKCTCMKCGNPTMNYMNGLDICEKCSKQEGICKICGRPVDVTKTYNKLIKQKLDTLNNRLGDDSYMANDLLDLAIDIIDLQSDLIKLLEKKGE